MSLSGPHHGHYITIVKSRGSWLVFDDDAVDTIKESDIPKYFGESNSGSAYVLYYQAVDLDLVSLGLRSLEPTVPDSVAESDPIADSPMSTVPLLPPGLTHEGDSDISDPPIATPASPVLPPSATSVIEPPSLSVTFTPPEPTPALNSPATSKPGFFSSIRNSPSGRSVGTGTRTSLYATLTAVPNLPTFGSPKVQNEVSEASTSNSSTAPALNGKVKAPKEKASGWFQKRKVTKSEKSDKMTEVNLLASRSPNEHRERSDDASIVSSSTSSRTPLPESSSSFQPSNTPPMDSQHHSQASTPGQSTSNHLMHMSPLDSSSGSHLPSAASLASSPSSELTSPSTSSSSTFPNHHTLNSFHSHTHNLVSAFHIPGHKKSHPTLNSGSSPSSNPSSSKLARRPSTAGATAGSSPTGHTSFPTLDESYPVPPIPAEFLSSSPTDEPLPLPSIPIPQTNGDSVPRRRNSVQVGSLSASTSMKRPPRKMSLTGGMLGFGRKDKGKDKDPSLPDPSSPSHSSSIVPGMSMLGRI